VGSLLLVPLYCLLGSLLLTLIAYVVEHVLLKRPNIVVYVEYVLGNYLEKSMSSYCHMSKYLGWSLRQEIFSFDLVNRLSMAQMS
jgi:hypothetical protein